MNTTPYLSVVIPSYNEKRNIERGVIDQILKYLDQQSFRWEVVFTDDGSTDNTVNLIEETIAHSKKTSGTIKVLKNIHAGKGPTVQAGMLSARGQWRLFTDFDQSTPLSEVEKLFPFTDRGYEIVIGSREIVGAKREKEPLHRHVMGRVFNLMVQTLAVPGIRDTQCGFKLFSAHATQDLFPRLQVYGKQQARQDAFTGAFDVEVLYLGRKHGYQIKEVPIIWHHNYTDRVSAVKDSLRMLRDIINIRVADLSGAYRR